MGVIKGDTRTLDSSSFSLDGGRSRVVFSTRM